MRRLIRLGITLLMLFSLMAPAQSISAAERALRIAPEEWALQKVGEMRAIEVTAENVEGLYAAEIKLTFDPKLVEVVTADGQLASKVTVGEMLASGSKFEGANRVSNSAGTIHFLYTLLQQATGKSGSGVVMRFHLRVKALGNGAITIEKGDLVERSGQNTLTSYTPTPYHGRLRAASVSQPGADNSTGEGSGSQQSSEPTVSQTSASEVQTPSGKDPVPEQPIAVALTVGNRKARVSGADYQLLFAPYVASSGRTMVPVRFVSEALGATVAWESTTRTVRIVAGGKTIVLTIDSRLVTIDGAPQQLDAPAVLRPGATYVPLRLVSEAFGAKVTYDSASKRISITR